MPIALVGSAGTYTQSNLSATPPFGQATTAGNLLVGICAGQATALFTVTGPTGWVEAVDLNSAANNMRASLWYKLNCGAGETAPTFNGSGNVRCNVAEFSGADTVSPLDQIGSVTGTSSPQTATASGIDGGTGRLVVVCWGWRTTSASTAASVTDSMASSVSLGDNNATSVGYHGGGFYSLSVVTGTVADADTATVNTPTLAVAHETVVIASFKPAAVAVPSPPYQAPYARISGLGIG